MNMSHSILGTYLNKKLRVVFLTFKFGNETTDISLILSLIGIPFYLKSQGSGSELCRSAFINLLKKPFYFEIILDSQEQILF